LDEIFRDAVFPEEYTQAAFRTLSLQSDQRKSSRPITLGVAAGFVVVELLKGAIEYVGGRVMSSAFGDATITDVRTWIREAVAELEAFISEQLTELVMNEITSDLDGVIKNLREYASLKQEDQSSNKSLLEYSDEKTASLVSLSSKYDRAFFVCAAVMGYRLFCLYALYKLDNDQGHITTAKPEMDEFLASAQAGRDRIANGMAPETHLIIGNGYVHVGGMTHPQWGVFRDG
jgi:hypothetical protein